MSSTSRADKSNSMISNQEIWTGQTQQDPKSFTERFTVLKNKKPSSPPIKNKKNFNRQKTYTNKVQVEDYVEDEIDESVAVSKPKNINTFTHNTNRIGTYAHTMTETNIMNTMEQRPTVSPLKSRKVQGMNNGKMHKNNIAGAFSSNKANQIYNYYNNQQNEPQMMSPMPNQQQKEINFININIQPHNARFTQNIYMHFPQPMQTMPPVITQPILSNQIQQSQISSQTPYQQSHSVNYSNKINLDNIIIGSDKRTTLMLRNIPNKYTLNNIVDEIGSAFWGKYDCINLPIDYETKLNLGYAFINFTDPLHIIQFFTNFHLKKWSRYKSEKKMDMTYADKQGKKDITLKAENNYFAQDDKRFDFKTIKTYIEIPCVRFYISLFNIELL